MPTKAGRQPGADALRRERYTVPIGGTLAGALGAGTPTAGFRERDIAVLPF